MLSDGYIAYQNYAKKTGITHAQCYAHCRRKFYEARDIEPERAEQALDTIGALYEIEAKIRQQQLAGAAKRAVRQAESRPLVDRFFSGSTSSSRVRDYCQAAR